MDGTTARTLQLEIARMSVVASFVLWVPSSAQVVQQKHVSGYSFSVVRTHFPFGYALYLLHQDISHHIPAPPIPHNVWTTHIGGPSRSIQITYLCFIR